MSIIMIEDKDYIIKEIKKAVNVLAKLMGFQKAGQFEDIANFNVEQLDYTTLNNLLNEKQSLNHNEYSLAKTILQANYIKLKTFHQLNDVENFNINLKKWMITLELFTTKSSIYDFELMEMKDYLKKLKTFI